MPRAKDLHTYLLVMCVFVGKKSLSPRKTEKNRSQATSSNASNSERTCLTAAEVLDKRHSMSMSSASHGPMGAESETSAHICLYFVCMCDNV